jgi:integrase/recombinase XerD
MAELFPKSGRRPVNAAQRLKKIVATELAILLHGAKRPEKVKRRVRRLVLGMSLYGRDGVRKYLTAAERRRFIKTAGKAPVDVRLFCLILAATGCRLSEALALTPASFDLDDRIVTFETLKQRRQGKFRQLPLERILTAQLNFRFRISVRQRDPALAGERLWNWSRTTAWRRVKAVMAASNIHGTPAMPKGLRHAFGVGAFQANVPPHLVQRWLGHASLKTTAIYGDVIGREERAFAARMWRNL